MDAGRRLSDAHLLDLTATLLACLLTSSHSLVSSFSGVRRNYRLTICLRVPLREPCGKYRGQPPLPPPEVAREGVGPCCRNRCVFCFHLRRWATQKAMKDTETVKGEGEENW